MRMGHGRRLTALFVVSLLLTGLLAPLAAARPQLLGNSGRQGMSTRKKVVLLGGAALLYFLYRKHQARRTADTGQKSPQLYRSRNGGVYYRDPNGRPVWLTVPQQGVQVPLEDVRRYAPDYSRHRGPAPAIPGNSRSESVRDWLENAAGSRF